MILLSLLMSDALAHGSSYYTTRLSASADGHVWALVDGWGVLHSTEGSAWEWICEEGLGVTAVYDLEALEEGGLMVGTSDGIRLYGTTCGTQALSGLPELAQVGELEQLGSQFFAAVAAPGAAGVWACDLSSCSPTSLVGLEGDRLFSKSLLADGNALWTTVVHEADLASELYRYTNGAWELRAAWADGSLDLRLLHVDGDRVLAWAQPRSSSVVPSLYLSTDGGRSFRSTLETGGWQDPIPGMAVVGEQIFLSSYLGRTWRSTDGGESWTEVSSEAPLVRCWTTVGDEVWACTDHFADGFDVGRTRDGRFWEAMACMEQSELGACTESTCSALYQTFTTFGGTALGICGQQEDSTEKPEKTCGCGSASSALLLPLLLSVGLRRRRPAPAP